MLFTPETAREAGIRSGQTRRERKLAQSLRAVPNPETTDLLVSRASALNWHLERLKSKLAKEDDPRAILSLCQAIDRLEQSWARYANVPNPGNRKPGRECRA